jgi:hypothetical protein
VSLFGSFASWWSERTRPQSPAEDMRGDEVPEFVIDAAGWIHGPGVIHMPSARGRAKYKTMGGLPSCVVRHGTATAWGTASAIARSWRATLENHSAHVTIDVVTKDEQAAEATRWRKLEWHTEAAQLAAMAPGGAVIYQHRSLLTTAWHAAGSVGEGENKQVTSGTVAGLGLNDCAIGIEATCVGQVARKLDSQWRGWKSGAGVGYGPAVPADQVQTLGGKSWHTYHPAVLEVERELDVLLLARFPSLAGEVTITPSPYTVRAFKGELRAQPATRPAMAIGHIDVDPTRKADPYPTGAARGRGV